MNVSDVAEMLGKTQQTIRIGLQRGIFPFGAAYKLDENNKRYVYVIYPEKVKEYLGENYGKEN
ncbi:MAG: hypothetical protein SOR77_09785 [Peptoniphilus sp.]|uniref:hypothetical protein n=1 Tax=Peptoniphilus sp. TaxID=1971214 RepID=UPI002A75061D|nr:hypothetical protein [Peptoniphilus sp.]MDY2987910.1 hypothetical protein [Peptoniphilus sp.]